MADTRMSAKECDMSQKFTQAINRAVYGEPFSRLQRVIRDVINLHQADRGNGPDPDGRCFECAETWPCPTINAVASGLGVDSEPEDFEDEAKGTESDV